MLKISSTAPLKLQITVTGNYVLAVSGMFQQSLLNDIKFSFPFSQN